MASILYSVGQIAGTGEDFVYDSQIIPLDKIYLHNNKDLDQFNILLRKANSRST